MTKLTKPKEAKIQPIVDTLCTVKEAMEILRIRGHKTFSNRMKKGLFGEYAYIGGHFIVFLRDNIMAVKGNPDYFAATAKGQKAHTRRTRLSKKKMSDWIKSVIYSDI